MRNALIALLLFAPVAGCGTVSLSVPVVSASATTTDERLLAEAYVAYNAAAQTYLDLNREGLLPAGVKAKAKPALQTALRALNAADTARRAANAPNFTLQLQLASQAIAEATAVLPKGN